MRRFLFPIISFFILTTAIGLFCFLVAKNSKETIYNPQILTEKVKKIIKPDSPKIYGGILPHHLLTENLFNNFYEEVSRENPETIILIGPNHYNHGSFQSLSTTRIWETEFGQVYPDNELIETLIEKGVIKLEDLPFQNEHSIYNHLPFIRKYFPQAKIVPLILKPRVDKKSAQELARAINEVAPQKTLVLASVDFSHHLTPLAAEFHDDLSLGIIQSFDFDRLYNLEIDSPASIYTLLYYLKLKGAQKGVQIAHTNSALIIDYPAHEDVTSYLTQYFVEGESTGDEVATLLIFGDMMLGRTVETLMTKRDRDWPFQKIRGPEGNFFKGVDVIMANLEGPITDRGLQTPTDSVIFKFEPEVTKTLSEHNFNLFSLANNHGLDQGKEGYLDTQKNLDKYNMDYFGHPLEIGSDYVHFKKIGNKNFGFIGLNFTFGSLNEETTKQLIQETKNKADHIIVFNHWGVEYASQFSASQQNWAHNLIDWGADIVIGHHPHVVQGMEKYKGKLIFYSLGNFIFDQYFSKETQEGLALGLTFRNNELKIYLFPFNSSRSQPKLLSYDEKEKFWPGLLNISLVDEELKNEIKKGIINLDVQPENKKTKER